MKGINVHMGVNESYTQNIKEIPVECPYCHTSNVPIFYDAIKKNHDNITIFVQCTNDDCKHAYLLDYNESNRQLLNIPQALCKRKEFSKNISKVSSNFCSIYNEAYQAEQLKLAQITGVGYRKALEFLIKDYLIINNENDSERIMQLPLMKCIDNYVKDEKIKSVSKRAVWLGNDQTHYVRKWENKDIIDLKGTIDLCIHWIEAEIETAELLKNMPEGK